MLIWSDLDAPRMMPISRHNGLVREEPHHEQKASSLPIICLHLGQSIARCAIRYTSEPVSNPISNTITGGMPYSRPPISKNVKEY